MFLNCLTVALGGGLGAVCRYLFGLLPLKTNSGFPLATMIINLLGSFVIGLIVGFAQKNSNLYPKVIMFIKVGFCGGFTTFSTFSLESLGLFQSGSYLIAILYMTLSFVLCLAGTAGGLFLASR